MSMQFKVRATGTVTLKGIDASDLRLDATDMLDGLLSDKADVQSASVEEATVTIEADIAVSDIEVEAADLEDFDPDDAITDAVEHWDSEVKNVDFEVTDSPNGFETVEDAVGRDTAIQVYAALAKEGFEVN